MTTSWIRWNSKRLVGLAVLALLAGVLLAWPGKVAAQDGPAPTETPTPTPTPLPPPPLVELNTTNIQRATVFLMPVRDTLQGPVITCVGSGTLVSVEGLILTNAHTVVPAGDTCRSDRIVVALTTRLDEPPVPTYVAEVVDASQGLDLAVLRITNFLDGRIVEPGTLQLPFVELGNSETVRLDDTILIAGYVDIENTPVQAIRGTISGFTAEARVGDRAWLRTNAPVPGMMSGGGAYGPDGRLIGIPTISPAIVGGEVLDCRSVQDTNADGQVNADDSCIPVGGFISALRPVRLARGLVRAATLGVRLDENRVPVELAPPTEAANFERLFVTTGVNAAGQPVNVVERVPAGTTSLYLFFDFENMVNGMTYELRTTVNGRPNPNFSLPSVTWNGGRRGMWYIGAAGVPWPNGQVEFALFIQGRQVATHSIVIGGAAPQLPAFSDISFGLQDNQGEIMGGNFVIPETNIVRARFNYRNMQPGMPWTQVWYLEDTVLTRTTLDWGAEAQGVNAEPAIQSQEGLVSGRYRLELYIEERLAATSDFVIAGGAEGAQADIFSGFRFANQQTGGVPQPPIGDEFVAGTEQLYVFFNWRQLFDQTPWTWRWLIDNDPLFEVNTQWAAPPSGENYFISIAGQPNLPDGTYTFQIEMGGIILAEQEARIGLGQLPLDAFASAEGVTLTGRVVDAQTGQGIPGALFIMLQPEFSVEDFLWNDSQILATSLADTDGFFQLPALLPRGTREEPVLYSLLVRADGYLPMSADAIPVTDETESPLNLTIELDRD
ncbi:MAG: trypsin-like peptidase domain-containing protein [Anaerolineales bacterium]